MFVFNRNYFIAASLLFVTEVFIAHYLPAIKSYLGDPLVVILLYCMVKSLNLPAAVSAISAYFGIYIGNSCGVEG